MKRYTRLVFLVLGLGAGVILGLNWDTFFRDFSGQVQYAGLSTSERSGEIPRGSWTQADFAPVHSPDFWVGGIQINEGDQDRWIRSMLESGMNTVEVTVYAHQGRWNDNNLWYPDRMHGLIQEIRLAKAAGMKVVLILRLQMDHAFSENKFLWHGMIRPESEYFLWRWFEQYYDFANKWSRIAEEEKVDMVVLGSEMNALFSTTIVDEVPGLEEYYLNDAKQKRYHDKVLAAGKNRLKEEHLFVYNAPNYTDLSQYLVDQSAAKKKWAETVAFSDSTDQMHAINVRRTIQNDYWERLIRGIRLDHKG